MSAFFTGLTVFFLLGLLVFVPFGRRIDWSKNYRREQNIALYRQQMQTRPSPALAEEFGRRLLADERQLQHQSQFTPKSAVVFSPKIAFGLWLILCLIPTGYYFSLPRFETVNRGQQAFAEARQKREVATAAEKNDDYIISLQHKLRNDPNNGEAWIALGQAYMLNNEFENALTAYANAEGLLGSKPAILGLAATALYYQAGQKITPKARQLINFALKQDPQETSSLSLLASDAFLKTDYARALQFWQRLLDSGRSDIDRRNIIRSMQMAEKLQKVRQQ